MWPPQLGRQLRASGLDGRELGFALKSTLKGCVPPYLGADLTDRYSKGCRNVDVCGLTRGKNGKLMASFWAWWWDAAPAELDVIVIAEELGKARIAMLDGPQGLAAKGSALRACEKKSAAVGKTPDTRPTAGLPFSGFIRSSLDLFQALKRKCMCIDPPKLVRGVFEVYPGHIWTIFSGSLPKKSTPEGRLARKRILEVLGVRGLPDLPTHDQNDAAIAAVMAAAADGKVPGVRPKRIGLPLYVDSDATLREGQMVIPEVSRNKAELISKTLQLATSDANGVALSGFGKADNRAKRLLDRLIAAALNGNALVCTYSWAYRYLFGDPSGKWSPARTKCVVEAAKRTSHRNLPGLGPVSLDAFVVTKNTRLPGGGHWQSAKYHCEDWERVLGTARVLADAEPLPRNPGRRLST